MTIFSEDSTMLAGGLVMLGIAFLVALKATQRGKYLAYAGGTLGLALLVVAVEWFWVTDNERIEQAVYALRSAVARADVDGVFEHLADDVQYQQGGSLVPSELTRSMIRTSLSNASFDFVRVAQLRTNVGRQSRRGTAEFRVFAKGRVDSSLGGMTIGTADSEWSLSFREVEPHVWKVAQITPVSIPSGVLTRDRMVMPNREQMVLPNRNGDRNPNGFRRQGYRQH